MTRRCDVCGYETPEAVCPQCATILPPTQSVCAGCGKSFTGSVALCDACGAPVRAEDDIPVDEEAVRHLASIPGISEARARILVERGFREVADIVRLALPESDIRRGLHHVIARHVLLADLVPAAHAPQTGSQCRICAATLGPADDRCATCGWARTAELPAAAVEAKLQEVTQEMVSLASDTDFRGMPDEVRRDFLAAVTGMNPEDVIREECVRQINAWRERGFDVAPLEGLLASDVEGFRERSVRLIRAQIVKGSKSGVVRCPLCDARVPPEAEACEDCGAKFA